MGLKIITAEERMAEKKVTRLLYVVKVEWVKPLLQEL